MPLFSIPGQIYFEYANISNELNVVILDESINNYRLNKDEIKIRKMNCTVSDAKKTIIYYLDKNITENDIDILIKPKNPTNDDLNDGDDKFNFPREYPYLNYKNEYRVLCDSQFLHTIGEKTIYVVKKELFVTFHYYIKKEIQTRNFLYNDNTKVIDLMQQINIEVDDNTKPIVLYMGKILNTENKLKEVIIGHNVNFYVTIQATDDKLSSSDYILTYLIINNSKAKTKEINNSSSIDIPSFKGKTKNELLQYMIQLSENTEMDDSKIGTILRSIISQNKTTLLNELDKEEEIKDSFKGNRSTEFQILNSSDIDNIVKLDVIGHGVSSTVTKVIKGECMALKTIFAEYQEDEEEGEKITKESFNFMKNLFKEYEILNLLNHPNIVKTYGIFFGDEKNQPSILLEYCSSNLKKSVKKLTNVQRVSIIYEISDAMMKVHSLNIIHRDLKPGNILLDDNNHVKVSDFGLSSVMNYQSQSQMSFVGSLNFIAPEIVLQKNKYNQKVDVYSFGVIVYFILTKGMIPDINILQICKGEMAKIPDAINKISKNLITKCWSFEPNNRPSFEQIVDIIIKNKFKLIDDIDINDPIIQNLINKK